MAGLVTAWELSSGSWRDRYESITLYQRGWRLGGKGASSRGTHARIEEHGLHVLLGYYDATFRVLRACYEELDRGRTDPDCPIRSWRDAFAPASAVGLAERRGDRWDAFVTRFSTNDQLPGEPGAEDRELTPTDVAVRGLRLLGDFLASLEQTDAGAIYLSARPEPRPVRRYPGVRSLVAAATAGLLEIVARVDEASGALAAITDLAAPLDDVVGALRGRLEELVQADGAAHRTWLLIDLVVANIRGVIADGLLEGPERYGAIDDLDYREWLAKHGADDQTLDSPIVRGMYDLAFAYEDGDPSRPAFSAGLGLQLAGRMLFDFKGSIFWKMQAGMGETVVAPLYQVLRHRGVRFEFFHRVDRLRLDAGLGHVAAIELGRQATVAIEVGEYEPLVRIGGLPCWPAAPLVDQLAAPVASDLESHWGEGADVERITLAAGEDFDVAVFALSLGMVPEVASELVDASPRWRAMVREVRTVATQSFQLWLRASEEELGWRGAGDVTLSGFVEPFDTWASMTHLIGQERWPDSDAPRSIAYFCSALDERRAPSDPPGAKAAADAVRQNAISFLENDARFLWPDAVDRDGAGFRWSLLCGNTGDSGGTGAADAFDSQYWRANVDPSDRYVQSVPGSGRYRIAPADTGYANLVVAGDWTDCGLNAGCVEAATRSGVLAARAVDDFARRDVWDG